MRKAPTPRPGVYELYWGFASRRQAAFEKRQRGEAGPWSDDPILQRFKFCNVFRAADRVSQYMIQRVIYSGESTGEGTRATVGELRGERGGELSGERSDKLADLAFQITAFRTFSKIETWDGLRARLGRAPTLGDLESGAFGEALDDIKRTEGGLYTGAFILCANKAYGHSQKHKNHEALFREMFLEQRLGEKIVSAASLREVVGLLQGFPLMGPFMAYQTAIDLNYSTLIDFDEDDYTQAGPGAMRGLKKVFVDLGDYTPAETILWMVARQEEEFARLGLPFEGLYGRRLHGIDCQGLFCETDKYCREAAPELASNRTRIKARFAPMVAPPSLFFPPKWGLNERLRSARSV